MSNKYKNIITKYLKNYRSIAERVKSIAMKYDPEVEVYVFGSIVRGTYTAASDIDILVVTKRIDLKYEIMVDIYRQVEAPIELHIVTQELFEKWYKRFVSPSELVKI